MGPPKQDQFYKNHVAGTEKEATSSVKQQQPMLGRSKEQNLKAERPKPFLPPKVIYKQMGPVFPEAAILSPPPTVNYLLLLQYFLK